MFAPSRASACCQAGAPGCGWPSAISARVARPPPDRKDHLSLGALPPTQASFLPTDYDDLANWNGGVNDIIFSANPTADQVVTFDGNLALSSSWTTNNTALSNRSLIGSGADRTITLGGTISLGSSATNANKVTIASTTAGRRVNLDLGGSSRTMSGGTNRTLEIVNDLSGTGSVTRQGLGTLTGTANTSTDATSIGTSGQVPASWK